MSICPGKDRTSMPLTSRRTFLAHALSRLAGGAGGTLWLSALPRTARGQDPEKSAAELMTPATLAAIDRGLAYLASQQQDDGSFGTSGYARNVAVAALAGMGFMSAGSTPGRGPYGANVQRCVDLVLEHTQESGFITIQ